MAIDTLDVKCVNGTLWFHADDRPCAHSYDHFARVCVSPEDLVWSCFFNGSHTILTCTCGFSDDAGFESQYSYCLNGYVYWIVETTKDDGIFTFCFEYKHYVHTIQTIITQLYDYYKAGNKMVCECGEDIDWYPNIKELRELRDVFSKADNLYHMYRKDRLKVWKIAMKYGCTQEECNNIVSLFGASCTYNEPDENSTLHLVMGLPASGKTSFCQQRYYLSDAISLDKVRTRANEQLLMDDAFGQHISFAIDNTNVTRAERAKYIAQAKSHGYMVEGYFMQSILRDCLERNAKRQGKARVPDKAILTKSKQMELPSYSEGFDRLWYVSMSDNGEFNEQQWKEEE